MNEDGGEDQINYPVYNEQGRFACTLVPNLFLHCRHTRRCVHRRRRRRRRCLLSAQPAYIRYPGRIELPLLSLSIVLSFVLSHFYAPSPARPSSRFVCIAPHSHFPFDDDCKQSIIHSPCSATSV